jgi:hypothetical protein
MEMGVGPQRSERETSRLAVSKAAEVSPCFFNVKLHTEFQIPVTLAHAVTRRYMTYEPLT